MVPAAPVALCLGGMDPSGGAGLLRDVMTVAALGVHPMAVATAETVQNGLGCLAIHPPHDPRPALAALAPHLEGTWGVKLGLCALDPGVLSELAAALEACGPLARIWDPVLAPTAGVGLHDGRALRAMAGILLGAGPWVVAPNLPEAAALAGLPVTAGPAELAAPLLDMGAAAVWLKGGHGQGDLVEDFWITRDGAASLGAVPRLAGDRRGTGCALASAWLAFRLLGLDGPAAAATAATFLRNAWAGAVRPGGAGRPCFGPAGRPR